MAKVPRGGGGGLAEIGSCPSWGRRRLEGRNGLGCRIITFAGSGGHGTKKEPLVAARKGFKRFNARKL